MGIALAGQGVWRVWVNEMLIPGAPHFFRQCVPGSWKDVYGRKARLAATGLQLVPKLKATELHQSRLCV